MKQKNLTRISVFLCMLLLMFSSASSAYAETDHYECRDGRISIYKESGWDSWQITEVDKAESSGRPFEHIMTAEENGSTDTLMFDMYFSADAALDGDYVYLYGDENEALDYYDKYGKNALVQLYTEQIASADPGAQITYGTPAFTEYQRNSFLKTDIVIRSDIDGDGQQENRTDTVFLTASMTSNGNFVINEALVFHNGYYGMQLTQEQQDTAAEIVDGFFEYGYGDDMTGDNSGDAVYYAEGISDGAIAAMVLFTVVIVLIIAVIVIVIILRRRKMSSRAAGAARERRARQSSSTGAVTQQAVSSDEQRYLDSLKTLYKSGLLTRAEMNEMIERHQVQNMRRRGGRP